MEFSLVKVINKTELIFPLYLVYKESIIHKRYCAFDSSKLSEFIIVNKTLNSQKIVL